MSRNLNKKSIARNYLFLGIMLAAMVLGCIVGWIFPAAVDEGGSVISGTGATVLKPMGTVFINMMFCVVVPMVFASISSAVANMESRKRAGKIMGVTVGTFVVTGHCRRHHVCADDGVPAGARRLDESGCRGDG